MQYDEKHFKKSANRKAMVIWLVLCVVLSGAYAMEIAKGLREIPYYIQFLSLCWVPFFLGILFLRIKGMHSDVYKYCIALGYGTFYAFVLLTTTSMLAFVYLLPLTSMLILYKDRNFMVICGVVNLAVLGVSIGINIQRGFGTPTDITQYEIQVACTVLCYIGYILAINHLNSSDGALMGSLKGNLDRVVHTVETVKIASNEIVDGMFSVRELADDNIAGANTVVNGMTILTGNNAKLQSSTASSLNLTEEISSQVQNVASKVGQMVELAMESTNHAKASSEELADVVTLSTEVEEVLREFKNQFKTMTAEINTIEGITSQTNILSLNASVEAARAGYAGKGFAVVAGEIRGLSSKTKASSDSIFSALQHLESTSNKMTDSITKTLEKVRQVTQSVQKITVDTAQMGENTQIIDGAISEVKTSNAKLVDNMHDVSQVVELMTESIHASEETTKDMLAKNVETTKNVAEVETIVSRLMENLGVIGVMGIKDIRPGQIVSIHVGGNESRAQIEEIKDETVFIAFHSDWNAQSNVICDFVATVDNSYYKWEGVELTSAASKNAQLYKVVLAKRPNVINRRKFKRVPLSNMAQLTILESGQAIRGQMINISEGGFAFRTNDSNLAHIGSATIRLTIDNLPAPRGQVLDAKVIRVSEDRTGSTIGCRFLNDNIELMRSLGSVVHA